MLVWQLVVLSVDPKISQELFPHGAGTGSGDTLGPDQGTDNNTEGLVHLQCLTASD